MEHEMQAQHDLAEQNELDLLSEEARQKVADADAVMKGGLDGPAKIAVFARLMFEAGFAECQEATRVAMAALSKREHVCDPLSEAEFLYEG